MLARVEHHKDGIVDYLVNGLKQGREQHRDTLDERLCIDGDLQLTDEIIQRINLDENRKEAYLHITLSFNERDISEQAIRDAYELYKEKLMIAYDSSEYHSYAEIHFPKIKSYQDKKTGETIERYPHVHMVIPKINLVTQTALNPVGRYTDNITYHDSIQEYVNRSLKLESPYDHQRLTINKDDSEFLSRYKGDTFGDGKRDALKKEWFDLINEKDIRSVSDFEKALADYGEVGRGKAGAVDEYLKVRPHGESKFIRLKEVCFKSGYIEDRELQRPKPTDKQIAQRLDEWSRVRSFEVKHIHPSSKARKEYYPLNEPQKEEYLNECRERYNEQHNIRESGRQTNRKLGTERVGLKRFTELSNGLPSVPPRGLVRANRERTTVSQSVLSRNEHHHLESARTRGNHQLRRAASRRGRGRVTESARQGLPAPKIKVDRSTLGASDKPQSVPEQLLHAHYQDAHYQRELEHFRVVRQTLDPELLLDHLERSHALVSEHYSTFRSKDGSPRIRIGTRAFNVSDFCTKHMNLSWDDTKAILSQTYQAQQEVKQEQRAINSISFVSQRITQGYQTQDKLSRLDESIQTLKFLQRKEQFGGDTMSLDILNKYRKNDDSQNSIEDPLWQDSCHC